MCDDAGEVVDCIELLQEAFGVPFMACYATVLFYHKSDATEVRTTLDQPGGSGWAVHAVRLRRASGGKVTTRLLG
jgi:hypothetical protein